MCVRLSTATFYELTGVSRAEPGSIFVGCLWCSSERRGLFGRLRVVLSVGDWRCAPRGLLRSLSRSGWLRSRWSPYVRGLLHPLAGAGYLLIALRTGAGPLQHPRKSTFFDGIAKVDGSAGFCGIGAVFESAVGILGEEVLVSLGGGCRYGRHWDLSTRGVRLGRLVMCTVTGSWDRLSYQGGLAPDDRPMGEGALHPPAGGRLPFDRPTGAGWSPTTPSQVEVPRGDSWDWSLNGVVSDGS
jgi:hypothetical protein